MTWKFNIIHWLITIIPNKMVIWGVYPWLVVTYPSENMKVNGKDDIPYMKWKIIQMFETTNQITHLPLENGDYHWKTIGTAPRLAPWLVSMAWSSERWEFAMISIFSVGRGNERGARCPLLCWVAPWLVPSGKLTNDNYWTWPFIVELPIKKCNFP